MSEIEELFAEWDGMLDRDAVVECSSCGESGLGWRQVGGQWELDHECGGPVHLKECRYCGEVGLEWFRVGGSWRLRDRFGSCHVCRGYDG